MRLQIALVATLLTTNVFAKIDGEQFLKCFDKASQEVIQELKVEGKAKGICSHLSEENLNSLITVFADIDAQNNITWVSADEMGKVRARDIYDILKNKVECYKPVTKDTGIIPDLINIKSYHQNMNLTQRAISKMIGTKVFKEGYHELADLNLSYCGQ